MSGRRSGKRSAARRPVAAPLDLIHTNNSPKPVSMRVSASLENENGLSLWQIRQAMEVLQGPIGFLIHQRRCDVAKST